MPRPSNYDFLDEYYEIELKVDGTNNFYKCKAGVDCTCTRRPLWAFDGRICAPSGAIDHQKTCLRGHALEVFLAKLEEMRLRLKEKKDLRLALKEQKSLKRKNNSGSPGSFGYCGSFAASDQQANPGTVNIPFSIGRQYTDGLDMEPLPSVGNRRSGILPTPPMTGNVGFVPGFNGTAHQQAIYGRRDVQNFMESSKVHRDAMIAGGFIQGIEISAANQLVCFPRSAVLKCMVLRSVPPSHMLVMFQAWTAMKDRFKDVTDLKLELGEPAVLLQSTEIEYWHGAEIVSLMPLLFPKLGRLTLVMHQGARSLLVRSDWAAMAATWAAMPAGLINLRLIVPTTPPLSVMRDSLSSLTAITVSGQLVPEQWIPLAKLPNLRHVTVGSLSCLGDEAVPATATPEEWQRQWHPCLWETLVMDRFESLLSDAVRLPLPVRRADKPASGVHLKGEFTAAMAAMAAIDIGRNCNVLAESLNTVNMPLIIDGTGAGEGKIIAMAPLFARKDLFETDDKIQVVFIASCAGHNIQELRQVFPSILEMAFNDCTITEDVWSQIGGASSACSEDDS